MTERQPARAVPTSEDLTEAVLECLRDDLLARAEGRDRYLLQVCVAALQIVQRERRLAAAVDAAQTQLLAELGHPDEAALLAEIAAGPDPERFAVLVAALRRRVAADLAVVCPDAPEQ